MGKNQSTHDEELLCWTGPHGTAGAQCLAYRSTRMHSTVIILPPETHTQMTGPVIQWLPKPALTVNTKLHEGKEKWYKNVGALYIFHAKTPEDSFCKLFASSSTMSWYSEKTRSSIWSRRRRIRSAHCRNMDVVPIQRFKSSATLALGQRRPQRFKL